MSTLKTNTIQHLTSGFNNVVQFADGAGTQNGTLCRAWVQFDGETGSGVIRASFNVSSLTDNGSGNFTINFTNAMTDGNYSVICSGDGKTMGSGVATPKSTYILAANVRTQWLDGATVNRDPEIASVAVFR